MRLTPRQIIAYTMFGQRLDCMQQANDLVLGYISAQGDQKEIEKVTRELHGRSRSPHNTANKTADR